jgi:organic radical activating enzyme
VIEIFDSLQGEGYWTGTPMTFVRLAGCNAPDLSLDCVRWCDTAGSWDSLEGELLSAAAILERAHLPRMCLTGGEPLLQAEGVAELVAEAHRRGMRVHLETNGTIAPPPAGPGSAAGSHAVDFDLGESFDWTVVSPKPPAYSVAPEWEGLIDELKLVVDRSMDAATAERLAGEHRGAIVSVQPLWDGRSDRASQEKAVRLVLEHPEWRLSLQTHKFLGIR